MRARRCSPLTLLKLALAVALWSAASIASANDNHGSAPPAPPKSAAREPFSLTLVIVAAAGFASWHWRKREHVSK